jgi:hypothetical protein
LSVGVTDRALDVIATDFSPAGPPAPDGGGGVGGQALARALRLVIGLSRAHVPTRRRLLDRGLLARLHALEAGGAVGEAGLEAEVLMEILADAGPSGDGNDRSGSGGGGSGGGGRGDSDAALVGAEVRRLRELAKQKRKEAADRQRERALQAMAHHSHPSGSSGPLPSATPALADALALSAAAPPIAAAASASACPLPLLPLAPRVAVPSSLAAAAAPMPAWMLEMEAMDEEDALVCVVCQEGYAFKPEEPLGTYVFVKSCMNEALGATGTSMFGAFEPVSRSLSTIASSKLLV